MPYEALPKVLVWGSDIEAATIQQAGRSARLPFVTGHVALMPDAHVGLGATVGSVIPTKGAIIPAAVGVDVGCGVCALRTTVTADQLPDSLDGLMSSVASAIPAGVGQGHGTRRKAAETWFAAHSRTDLTPKLEATALKQYGTLGSGNHFVEVCLDTNDQCWLVLHSGSRGVGNQLAQRHIKVAQSLMDQFHVPLEDRDLAYLPQGTAEFDAYIRDLLWLQDYALGNRDQMMHALVKAFAHHTGVAPEQIEAERINCHHNFSAREHHHGADVWITRKGAIRARAGDRGVIPGSMGTASYIVTGLGNPASYHSCSHGAGRRMSRSKARAELSAESLTAAMGTRTWNANRAEHLVDEHPEAYKDIGRIMDDQADLVRVDAVLRQIFNYKG